MLFWMTSKTFRDIFLENEKDQDILDAQYVLASTRIVYKKADNVISARNILYPAPDVCSALTDYDFRERYLKQLAGQMSFLSVLIRGSIDEGYHIIFLCTKSEKRGLNYLQYLSEFIYMYFDYPCYEYKNYASGATKLIDYDVSKVLKKCNKYIAEAEEKQRIKDLKTDDGRKKIMKDYKLMSKKSLKKILKRRGLYSNGMDKDEMLDTIETFLD